MLAMTKLLEQAFEAATRLPPEVQDEIGRTVLQLARNTELEEVDSAHLPAILEGLTQAKRGQFASDAEIESAFRRFDR